MLERIASQHFKNTPCNQRVLLRVDYNIPRHGDTWHINQRVTETIDHIQHLLKKNCAVVLVSHKGRPTPGEWQEKDSLETLAPLLSNLLDRPVHFLKHWPLKTENPLLGHVYLAENTRFLVGETANSQNLSALMVQNIDCIVMDAFACSHRSHASTTGILSQRKAHYLGANHLKEIQTISHLCHNQEQKMALMGGKKIGTKIGLLSHLSQKCSDMCIGGGLANTLLFAKGFSLGCSWVEYERIEQASNFMLSAEKNHCHLHLPCDFVVVDGTPTADAKTTIRSFSHIQPNESIVDIGPKSVQRFSEIMQNHSQIYWNGPMGLYEQPYGIQATEKLARSITRYATMSCIGGGDTLSATAHLKDIRFTHKSTGGGAFLHFLANRTSPVLEAFLANH